MRRIVSGAGGLLAENLTYLAAIDGSNQVSSLLPLSLAEADGAAMALEPA